MSVTQSPETIPETRPLAARDPRLEPWRAFLQAHARISRRLDEELRVEHDLSLAEYDALLTIADAPARRIRMRQLADRVLLSKSGVTRLVDRLVADGLVERDTCLSDARGAEAVLTDAGLVRLRRASRTHLRGIDEHFLAAVEADALPVIQRSMLALADRLGPGGDDDHCQQMAAAIRLTSGDDAAGAAGDRDTDG
jgi:DNA-binding MarR family transcriptional regulator